MIHLTDIMDKCREMAPCRVSASRPRMSSDHYDRDQRMLLAPVEPPMAGAVLNETIALLQEERFTVVELKAGLTFKDNLEIDRIGGMHAGMVGLDVNIVEASAEPLKVFR